MNFPSALTQEEKDLKDMFEKLRKVRKAIGAASRNVASISGANAGKVESRVNKRSIEEAEVVTAEVKKKVMSGVITGNSSGGELMSPRAQAQFEDWAVSAASAYKTAGRSAQPLRGPTLNIRSYDLVAEPLYSAFGQFGTIKDLHIDERQRSALITFSNANEAEAALNAMDGNMINGITVRASFARDQSQAADVLDTGSEPGEIESDKEMDNFDNAINQGGNTKDDFVNKSFGRGASDGFRGSRPFQIRGGGPRGGSQTPGNRGTYRSNAQSNFRPGNNFNNITGFNSRGRFINERGRGRERGNDAGVANTFGVINATKLLKHSEETANVSSFCSTSFENTGFGDSDQDKTGFGFGNNRGRGDFNKDTGRAGFANAGGDRDRFVNKRGRGNSNYGGNRGRFGNNNRGHTNAGYNEDQNLS
ncbi:RNA recognition motif domain-containing protein [Ditylenchus destructor]|nr:RNA recognition motif domain-containing protein [Ditylenchus destructor]